MDEGIDWVRTVLGDVEFADDIVTCSAASFALAVEQLCEIGRDRGLPIALPVAEGVL